jgi:hypothetical protein
MEKQPTDHRRRVGFYRASQAAIRSAREVQRQRFEVTPMPLTVAIIFVIGLGYVLLPLALEAYFRFRLPQTIACPESLEPASIRLDAFHAATSAALGSTRLAVLDCSRWPERHDCARACTTQMAR